jgi:hypothetical protein
MLFPVIKHNAIFYGIHCGKSTFAFDLLEGPYYKKFNKIFIVSKVDRRDCTRPWMGDENVYFSTTILETIDPLSYSGRYRQLVILDAFCFEKEDVDIALRVYSNIPKLTIWLLTRDIKIPTICNFRNRVKWVVTFNTSVAGWFKPSMYISRKLQYFIAVYHKYTKYIHVKNKEIFILSPEITNGWRSAYTKVTI